MKVAVIADEIHRDLDSPSTLSPSAIGYWVRENIGALNNLIFTVYELSESGAEISPELGENEKAILKKIYMVYYYGKKVNENLGAASNDIVVEVSQDGQTVRKVNKIELSKTYIQLKKDEGEELKKLIQGYKVGKASPRQVAGDDVFEANAATQRYTTRELEE
jgi:hypothetical protein